MIKTIKNFIWKHNCPCCQTKTRFPFCSINCFEEWFDEIGEEGNQD